MEPQSLLKEYWTEWVNMVLWVWGVFVVILGCGLSALFDMLVSFLYFDAYVTSEYTA